MLQKTDNAQSLAIDGSDVSPSAMLREGIDFAIGFLRRRYLVVSICVLLGLALGALYLYVTPPSYTASATMMIETRKAPFLQQSVLGDIPIDAAWMETQIGLVRSESTALAVVKQLRLADDPKFAQAESGLRSILPAPVSSFLGLGNERGAVSEAALARQLLAGIEVRRVGASYVVRIEFTSFSPEQSIKIANALVEAYIVEQLNAKDQVNRRTRDWLQERFQTLREQALVAERAVAEFKARNNIVSAGGRTLSEQQLIELNTQLGAARTHTAEVQSRLNRVLEVLQADQADAIKYATAVAEISTNQIIQRSWNQLLELTNREADWNVRYGADHASVVKLRDQIRDIGGSIRNELKRVAESYKSEYELAKNRQDELANRLAQAVTQSQDQSQITLRGLESSAASYQTLYGSFLQRYMEAVQQQSFPVTEARLLSPATGVFKSHPRPTYAWTVALLAGVAFGLGLGTLREVMDGVFRTSGQAQSALEAECLALIPLLKNDAPTQLPKKDSVGLLAVAQTGGGQSGRSISTDARMLRAVVDAPLSQYSEALRFVKLAADLSQGGTRSAKVIGVTSALPGEGKSSLSIGLAEIAARGDRRVILVDCDLRNPALSRMLAPEAKVGLFEVVSGETSLEEATWNDPGTGMAFLPSIVKPDSKNSSDILAADSTKKLFDELKSKYDYVVVDLSPLAPIADVRAASRFVDSYILVIEWGHTKVDIVHHALNHARNVQENLMGVVLNKVDMDAISKYERKDARYNRYKKQRAL